MVGINCPFHSSVRVKDDLQNKPTSRITPKRFQMA
ncbi:hypothetical protein T07_6864 [Trichinella nelsoni]|uniref:Uncharacterized protein n=1 Tax=Trichinella nelsoni TaxID=6336 RepID=A0A0V0RD61_9BILA|nr:hypothetical protein T07_6864 [Trichinella nelsoni]